MPGCRVELGYLSSGKKEDGSIFALGNLARVGFANHYTSFLHRV